MTNNESYQYVIQTCTPANQKVSDAWAAYTGMSSLATLNCHIALSAAEDCVEAIKEARELLEHKRTYLLEE